jgi:hypothetical protein
VANESEDEAFFKSSPIAMVKDMLGGGVNLTWSLALCLVIGVWLMFTRLTLGSEGSMANADHLIGSLVLTVTVTATAEVMRTLRFLNVILGAALLITPFVCEADGMAMVASLLCGVGLIGLSIPRGEVRNRYGEWSKTIL